MRTPKHDMEQRLLDMAVKVRGRALPDTTYQPTFEKLAKDIETLAKESRGYGIDDGEPDPLDVNWIRKVIRYVEDIEAYDEYTFVKDDETGEWYWKGKDIRKDRNI